MCYSLATASQQDIWETFHVATSRKRAVLCTVSSLALSPSSEISRSGDTQGPGNQYGFICMCLSGVQKRAELANHHLATLETTAAPQKCAGADTNADGIDWLQQSHHGATLLMKQDQQMIFYGTDQDLWLPITEHRCPGGCCLCFSWCWVRGWPGKADCFSQSQLSKGKLCLSQRGLSEEKVGQSEILCLGYTTL